MGDLLYGTVSVVVLLIPVALLFYVVYLLRRIDAKTKRACNTERAGDRAVFPGSSS